MSKCLLLLSLVDSLISIECEIDANIIPRISRHRVINCKSSSLHVSISVQSIIVTKFRETCEGQIHQIEICLIVATCKIPDVSWVSLDNGLPH